MAFDGVDEMPELDTGVVSFSPFKPDPSYAECDKERLVNLLLGSHEFLLLVIESWAAQVVVRYSLDEMFDIQWALWSREVLPRVRELKGDWMNITTNDVAAFMKDIQIDATSFPGKAFELIFEMPEDDVGIMTFNKCCAPDQWEALGRPDILEKNCHSTCPASLIETAKMYNPNMKVDILAIPPRIDEGDVCCKWKLSMRTEDDPEYVPVELTTKPRRFGVGTLVSPSRGAASHHETVKPSQAIGPRAVVQTTVYVPGWSGGPSGSRLDSRTRSSSLGVRGEVRSWRIGAPCRRVLSVAPRRRPPGPGGRSGCRRRLLRHAPLRSGRPSCCGGRCGRPPRWLVVCGARPLASSVRRTGPAPARTGRRSGRSGAPRERRRPAALTSASLSGSGLRRFGRAASVSPWQWARRWSQRRAAFLAGAELTTAGNEHQGHGHGDEWTVKCHDRCLLAGRPRSQ